MLAVVFATAGAAFAQSTYTIQEIVSPDYATSRATDINDKGAITGTVADSTLLPGYAFIYSGGEMTLITSAGLGSAGRGINNTNVVVGSIANDLEGFYYEGGEAVTLDGFIPFAVNNVGAMVGILNGDAVINNGGVITNLGAGVAYDINTTGQTAFGGPYQGYLYSEGSTTTLEGMGGPLSINGQGDVAGNANDGSLTVLIYSQGITYNLGFAGRAEDINDYMQVVGVSDGQAFLYSDGVMAFLKDLIPSDSGWDLTRAIAINNAGQIVGVGVLDGVERGFVLNPNNPTPTPEQQAEALAAYYQYSKLAQDYYDANIDTNSAEAIYYYYVYMGIAAQQYYTIMGQPDVGDYYYYDGIAQGVLWGYDDISGYYGYEAQASYAYYANTDPDLGYYYTYVNLANSWYYGYMNYYEITGDPTYQQEAIDSYNYYMSLAYLYI